MNQKIKGPFGEEIFFKKEVPKSLLKTKNSFWFVDDIFKNRPEFKNLKNVAFVTAGEDLKSFKQLESCLDKLLKFGLNRSSTIYCVGGGSLGDSIGFLSSIYMRGVSFVLMPTTWLSCVDSSIGGKTALNYRGYKNIVGSFYPASKHVYVESLVKNSVIKDAKGEILKTLFLNHNKKWTKSFLDRKAAADLSFKDLEFFVNYKTKIVKKDVQDKKGVRAVLNFGHSLGHALELNKKISHSRAVLEGLRFALKWSEHKKLLSSQNSKALLEHIKEPVVNMNAALFRKSLRHDKKTKNKNNMDFIFLTDKGPLVKTVTFDAVVSEFKRQGLDG